MYKKKITLFLSALTLGTTLLFPQVSSANQQQYQQALKLKPELKKFEKTPDFILGQLVTKEQLNAKGFYLDKEGTETSKFQFYLGVKEHEKIFNVEVSKKIYIVENMKVVGLIAELDNEKMLNSLKEALTKEFGNPKEDMQKNLDMTTAWGVIYDKAPDGINEKNIFPLALTYNIYHQKGALVWSAPSVVFNKK